MNAEITSQSSDSISFSVGDLQEVVRLELPCYVSSVESSFEMIGGFNSLKSSLLNDSTVLFRFPGTDPLKGCLHSSIKFKNGLLIKLRRKKISGDCKATVIGFCRKTIEFDHLADFQV